MQKVIDSMRAGKKAMLISKGNNAANKGSDMFEYPIFYSPDVSNIDWDTYSGALYFKSDWWMDSYTDVFHGNEIKLIPKWQYITVSILPGGIVKSIRTQDWSRHNNIPNVMSSLNVLGKTNEVEYTPTKDYHPATKKYVDDSLENISIPVYQVELEVSITSTTDNGDTLSNDDVNKMLNIINDAYQKGYKSIILQVYSSSGRSLILTNCADDIQSHANSFFFYGFGSFTRFLDNSAISASLASMISYQLALNVTWDGSAYISRSSSTMYSINRNILTTSNRAVYVPTGDYNPATKKYVDDNKYILPTATTDTLGGIKIGDGLSVDENGVVKPSPDVNVIFLDLHDVLEFPNSTIVTSRKGTLPEKYKLLIEGMINDALASGVEPGSFNIPNNLYIIAFKNYYMSLGTQQENSNLYGGNYSLWTTSILPISGDGVANPQCSIYFRLTYDSSTNTVTLTGDVSATLQEYPSSVSRTWVNNNFLSKKNTNSYTPTSNYHPATKKYVDDAVVAKQDVLTAGDNITIDENNVISSGKTNYLGYIEDYTSDNRLDITDLEKGTYSLGIKDRIGSQTLYLKVSHNGQEQTLDTELQIEPTVISNMVYFDVRHPIKDISGYDEAIRISFSYLNSITGEIVDTKYGIGYNNTSGILSNSARYNTKISAVTTNTEQVIMGKKTFNVLPESSVEPTNDNQFVNKKYVDGNKYELPIASTDTLGGIKIGENLSIDENGVVSASGCDIPVYNFKMTSEYRKATSTVTYVYMSSSDKTTLQNIIQDAYDKGLETFALFVNQRVGTYTGTNEMHQDYLLTIVNGKLIKNKPSSLLLAGYSQGNSTLTDVYLSKLNISLPLSWNEDSCTVGTTTYINIELRPLSSDNTIMYTPTEDYNPATKKYVDDQVGNINTVLATLTTVSEVTK